MKRAIAICNVCLKACEVVATKEFTVKSKCHNATVLHKNMKVENGMIILG